MKHLKLQVVLMFAFGLTIQRTGTNKNTLGWLILLPQQIGYKGPLK